MRVAGVLLTALALAACGRGAQRPADAPPPAPEAPNPTGPPTPHSWTVQSSATAGTALIYAGDEAQEALRIACRRNPADLYVSAPEIQRIGSEERLTLGAGSELAALVATPGAPDGAQVEAAGQLSAAFVDAVARGDRISVAYGATQLGPLPSVPDRVRTAFVTGCRQSLP